MNNQDEHNWLEKINLAGNFETPSQITDKALLRKQCLLFRKHFPDIKLYYAVKCFPDQEVIKTVDGLVDGYDAASVPEISMLLKAGVDAGRIGFSNPVKSCASIKEASKLGITKFAYQSTGELEKIARCAPGAAVYLRVKMHDADGAISFSSKFGCEQDEVMPLLHAAQDQGLKPIGITFHVGSQARDRAAWRQAIATANLLVKKAQDEGLNLEHINIGGGLPVQYETGDPSIEEIAEAVNNGVATNRPDDIDYIAEPGRFIAANSSAIVTTVIGVEERKDSTWLFLDIGTFQAFVEIFEFNAFPYPVHSLRHLLDTSYKGPTKNYVLTGPTCDSYDTMAFDITLPADITVGDELMIMMTGAYTLVYGSNFNGFDIPGKVFIDSDEEGGEK